MVATVFGEERFFSVAGVVILFGFVVIALMLGAVVLVVGTLLLDNAGKEVDHIRRAARVGATQNSLLVAKLQEANARYDIAAGFFGLIAIVLVTFAGISGLEWLGVIDPILPASTPTAPRPIGSRIATTALIVVLGFIIRHSATAMLRAIDVVLDELDAAKTPE
jgi:hypothetical protein